MASKLLFLVVVFAAFCAYSGSCKSLRSHHISSAQVQQDVSFLTQMTTSFLSSETISSNHKQELLKLAKIYVQDHRRFWLTVKALLVVFDFDHNGIVTFEDIQNRIKSMMKGFPEGLQQMVLQKLEGFRPIVQRLDMNRNGGIDIKSEGRIIAFIIRAILLKKLQHVNVNELEMSFLELLTMDSLELVDASINQKFDITTEQQQDVIKAFKNSALTMISISASSEFNKRVAKRLGLKLLKNLAHIYFDDAVLYRKLMRIQFQFFDANGDNVLHVYEVNNYFSNIAKKMQLLYTQRDKSIVRYAFNKYLKTHFKTGSGSVTWKSIKQRIEKIRKRHLKWVIKMFKTKLHIKY